MAESLRLSSHVSRHTGRPKRTRRHLRTYRGNPLSRGDAIALLVDAGPLYAYVDADDRHGAESLELLVRHPGPLIVPVLVITEVTHPIGSRLGTDAEIRFLGDLAVGEFTIEAVMAGDWLRIAELVSRYRDLPLGTVGGSVVATAERLGITKIATLDRRHFSIVRPIHADIFDLLP